MESMDIRSELLTDPAVIAAHAQVWDELAKEDAARLDGLDGTMSFAWFEALREAFPPLQPPALVVGHAEGRIQGLLPVIPLRQTLFGSQLGLPTELYGGRCAPLLAQPRPALLAALLGELARARSGWATLQITVVTDSPAAATLRESCRALGWHWTEQPLAPTVHFPLPSDDNPLRKSMSTNAWQNLRKAQNRAAKLGGRLSIREFDRPEQAEALLDAVLTIERDTWKHAAGSAITNNPQQQAFYRALFPRALREGMLLGLVLYLDEQPIAHHFGLLRQQVFSCLKHSHAQSQDALSPSNLLMAEMLERLRLRGALTFDCMGVVEPHKLRWSQSNASYQRSCFTLYNRTWGGQALRALRQGARVSRRMATIWSRPTAPAGEDGRGERLEVLAPGPELTALAPQWDALVRDDPVELRGLDMTSGACWFGALVESRTQAAQARVLVKRRGAELQALLPLVRQHRGPLGSQLLLATELYGGRNGLLLRRRDAAAVAELLRALPLAYPDWVTLQGTLNPNDDSLPLLREAAGQLGLRMQVDALPPTPYVELLDSTEHFNAGVSRSVLRNMRSSLRRASTLGHLHYREFRQPQDAEAMLEMLLDVERRSWKHQAGTAITARPEQEAFYRALAAPALRQGLLYTLALYLDEQPISYQLGLLRDGVYSCLKNSMDQAHAELRPSYLIKAELFDRLRAQGVQTVDLMGMAEPHKLVWSPTPPNYQRLRFTLYRQGAAGRLLTLGRALKSRFATKPAAPAPGSDEAITVT